MKAYQKYLEERLSDMYGKDAHRGMFIAPDAVEDGLIALHKKLKGSVPSDEDIKPFYNFIMQNDSEGLEKVLPSEKEPDEKILTFRTGTEG